MTSFKDTTLSFDDFSLYILQLCVLNDLYGNEFIIFLIFASENVWKFSTTDSLHLDILVKDWMILEIFKMIKPIVPYCRIYEVEDFFMIKSVPMIDPDAIFIVFIIAFYSQAFHSNYLLGKLWVLMIQHEYGSSNKLDKYIFSLVLDDLFSIILDPRREFTKFCLLFRI